MAVAGVHVGINYMEVQCLMDKKPIWLTVCVVAIWAAVALIGIFGPSFETADTTLPLSAIIAPVFGAVATGFVTIWAVST